MIRAKCSVAECRNASPGHDPLVVFYAFPKNDALRYVWKSACGDETLDLSKPSLAVCQDHFTDSDFTTEGPAAQPDKVPQLRYGSVPTENLPENAYDNYPDKPPVRKELDYDGEKADKEPVYPSSHTTKYVDQVEALKKQVADLKKEKTRMLNTLSKLFDDKEITSILTLTKSDPDGSDDEGSIRTESEQSPTSSFNDLIPAEDEPAVDQYLSVNKISVTRLKTT